METKKESKLLDCLCTELQSRHYSSRREQIYPGWVGQFICLLFTVKSKALLLISVLALISGCDANKSNPSERSQSLHQVTTPNGSTPANAPPAPMNDNLRKSGWNHGNGVLWVYLNSEQFIISREQVQKDGAMNVKFGWWRGIPGKFSITGRRLDGPAPPLRYKTPPVESYGNLGFLPSSLVFPTEGYWEITGHIDNQSLTFVVRVTKKAL